MPPFPPQTSLILIFLFILEALAVYTLWVQMHLNNHYTLMTSLRDYGPHLLPGTSIPLKKEYVGIEVVDYVLTVLVLSFAVVVDGSRMESTLFAVEFGGVVGVGVLIIWMESIRAGSGNKFIRHPTIWGLAIQVLGFGIVMPVWCITHLLSSSTMATSPQEISSLRKIPLSISVGYLLPTILMFFPRFLNTINQNLIALWQPFPLWILGFHFLLGCSPFYLSPRAPNSSLRDLKNQEQEALQNIYKFGANLARIPHVISLSMLALASLFPLLVERYTGNPSSEVTFKNAFIAPSPINPIDVESIAHGMHVFLLWDFYIGSAAMLGWGLWLNFKKGNISGRETWMEGLASFMWILVTGGVGTVVVNLMRESNCETLENAYVEGREQKRK